MKTGLVLDGGGAKGAYQIGVWEYLKENKIELEAITGTSVGGLNAALITQNDLKKAQNIWLKLDKGDVIELNKTELLKLFLQIISELAKIIAIKKLSHSKIKKLINAIILASSGNKVVKVFSFLIENGVFNTSSMVSLLDKNINYEKIPNKPKVFLTHVSGLPFEIADLTKYPSFTDAHPMVKRQLLIATSAIPLLFPAADFGGKKRFDAGGVDNSPITALLGENLDRIFVIHLSQKPKNHQESNYPFDLIEIFPSQDLGKLLDFSGEHSRKLIKLGYADAKENLKNI